MNKKLKSEIANFAIAVLILVIWRLIGELKYGKLIQALIVLSIFLYCTLFYLLGGW